LLIGFLPLDWISRKARFKLARNILNVVIAPFGRTSFIHSYVGDVLTSLTRVIVDFINTSWWIFSGNWRTSTPNYCPFSAIIISANLIPYIWRALMTAREFKDTKNLTSIMNMVKYLAAILMGVITYHQFLHHTEDALSIIISCIATIYFIYWDFVQDWGLFQTSYLRQTTAYPIPFYYVAMILNVVLRFNWILMFLPDPVISRVFHNLNWMLLFISVSEIFRRFIWSLIRIEYELLSNTEVYEDLICIPPIYLIPDTNESL